MKTTKKSPAPVWADRGPCEPKFVAEFLYAFSSSRSASNE